MVKVITSVVDGINVLSLSGGMHSEMGAAYGHTLAPVLQAARDDLLGSFAARGLSHRQLIPNTRPNSMNDTLILGVN